MNGADLARRDELNKAIESVHIELSKIADERGIDTGALIFASAVFACRCLVASGTPRDAIEALAQDVLAACRVEKLMRRVPDTVRPVSWTEVHEILSKVACHAVRH